MNESVCNSLQKWNRYECWCKCKELDDSSSYKVDCMCNPSMCDWECNKTCKTDEYLDIKNCSWEKRLFGKLLSVCEDEILNTTETSIVDTKVTCEKNNCLTYTVSLVTTCLLLLLVISICCY